jgi:hypothetical protein
VADPRRAAADADRRRALGRRAHANELARKKAGGQATDEEQAELAALAEERRAR